MEVRVLLKFCEGCGCLWYRIFDNTSVYCRACEHKLAEFPSPQSRKRRGRPCGKRLARVYAVSEEAGGVA